MIETIIAGLVIMAVSLTGILFVNKTAGTFLESNLSKFTAFAAGVFLVTAVVLAQEVFHIIDSLWLGVALIAGGYGLAWLVHYLFPEAHHSHDATCGKSARKLIIGDAIHNIGDGIILVPAFMASTTLGIAVTVSIIIHEAIQEISEFFVLKRAGYSTKKALAINFGVSSTIFIGIAIGSLALATTNLEGALLALTAGFFLHVVLHDLLPTKKTVGEKGSLPQHLIILLCGALLMFTVNTALGETHTHGESGHDHDHHEDHAHSDKHDHHDEHKDESHTEHEEHHEDKPASQTP